MDFIFDQHIHVHQKTKTFKVCRQLIIPIDWLMVRDFYILLLGITNKINNNVYVTYNKYVNQVYCYFSMLLLGITYFVWKIYCYLLYSKGLVIHFTAYCINMYIVFFDGNSNSLSQHCLHFKWLEKLGQKLYTECLGSVFYHYDRENKNHLTCCMLPFQISNHIKTIHKDYNK